MEDRKAIKLIDDIKADVEKNGFKPEKVVEQLKELREVAKENNEPTIVKCLRLTYEHIEDKGKFDISFFEESDSTEENFLYLLDLIRLSENQYNKEEIMELNTFLKEQNA